MLSILCAQTWPAFSNLVEAPPTKKFNHDRERKIPKSIPNATLRKGVGVMTSCASIAGGISGRVGWGSHIFRTNRPQVENTTEQ